MSTEERKAAQIRLEIQQGASLEDEFTWWIVPAGAVWTTYEEFLELATAKDLTNYTARAQGRVDPDDATPAWSFTSGDEEIVLGGTAGTIAFDVDPATTGALDAGEGFWALELEETGTGRVIRLAEGPYVVTREVAR